MTDTVQVHVDPQAVANAIMPDLQRMITDQVTAALRRLEADPAAERAGVVTNSGGDADPGIRSFGDFLLAIFRNDRKRLDRVYRAPQIDERGNVRALGEDSGAGGGYLVPIEYERQLLQVAAEVNPIDALTGPRRYTEIPMTTRTLTVPKLSYSGTPTTGNSAMTAGVVATWTPESTTATSTDPAFKQASLTAHKLSGYTAASNELEADGAVALEALLIRLFGMAIGAQRAYTMLRGTGVGQPLGVLNAPALISVTRATGAATLEAADVPAMVRRLIPNSMRQAVWIMHPYLISDLINLQFGSSAPTVAWGGNPATEFPTTLMGMPILYSEFCAAPGSAGDVILTAWPYYLVGQRAQTAIAVSDQVRFLTDERVWRFTHRMDGQPWLDAAITLHDGSSTVSPFVALS